MKYKFSLILLIFFVHYSFSQEVYLNVGRNFTTYDYTNSLGEENPNINSSSGSAYEIGYIFSIGNNLSLAAACTLDEFNATGGDLVNNYNWETNYLGFQGVLKYTIIGGSRSPFMAHVKGGLNFNHIISGEQKINVQTFNLTKENEFKGLFVKPSIGLDMQYFLLDDIALNVGYNYSKNFGISSGNEKLNFNNSQLQFGILMTLN